MAGSLLALLLLALSNGRFPTLSAPILSPDIEQHRIDTALPALANGLTIEQTFVSQHNGLSSVTVLLLVYENIDSEPQSSVTVALYDDAARPIAAQTLSAAAITNNQAVTLNFDPIHNARGRRFTIRASSDDITAVSLWAYSLNTVSTSTLTLSDPGAFTFAKVLRFNTQYRLTLREAARQLGEMAQQDGAIALLALLVVPLPGALALWFHKPSRRWARAARWGTATALGCAIWPLLWAALTMVNGRWTPAGLWASVMGGWILYFGFTIYDLRFTIGDWNLRIGNWALAHKCSQFTVHHSPFIIHNSLLLLLLSSSFLIRLLTVRDYAFPLWVDSSRHGLITAVMSQSGQIITSYRPYLPIDTFPYHYGFHSLSASLMMMGDFPLERLLLVFGQWLNALVALVMYSAVWLVTRRRGAALLIAFLVAFPFYFPGYYATWGRFTQLTGVIILPVLLSLTWQLVHGARGWQSAWWLAGTLAAGLFLIHFRVFLLYLPFALLVWPLGWRSGKLGGVVKAGALTAVLVGGRALTLWQQTRTIRQSSGTLIDNYNVFPTGYFTAGWDEYIIWSALGLTPLLLLGLLSRRRWGRYPLVLLLWTALLFLLVGSDLFGLSRLSLINLNSLYITLFVPLGLLLGVLTAWGGRVLAFAPKLLNSVSGLVMGMGVAILLLFGARTQLTIVNPSTVLARPADRAALAWLGDNTGEECKIAVGSWLWLGNTWAAQDGGAWIVPLLNRASTTPPADYVYDAALFTEVTAFNETAAAYEKEAWADVEAARWLADQGVTHVFVGAGGSFFDPAVLAKNPGLDRVYGEDGAFVFAVRETFLSPDGR